MDYCFASFLLFIHSALHIVISYDIMCQWSVHLLERLENDLPLRLQTTLPQEHLTFVIPKLHIKGHKYDCQMTYSLNLTSGSGRSDGEGIKRPWAHLGPIATSTREMGPGSHHDTLDDHLRHWNWKKLIGLGDLLSKCLVTATEESKVQSDALAAFSEVQSEHVGEWERQIRDWEMGKSEVNPYYLPHTGVLEQAVQLQLAEEEEAQAKAGTLSLHEVSPFKFITAGLEIKEMQCIFIDAKEQIYNKF